MYINNDRKFRKIHAILATRNDKRGQYNENNEK